jgi:sarcosine oxidase subunit gamma
MSEFELIHRPVLSSVSPLVAERIRLAPLPEGTVLQIFGNGNRSAEPGEAGACMGLSLRDNGPDQWLLIGDEPISRTALSVLASLVPDGFSIVDQSHGRVRIAVEGDAVEEVLAKGTGVDLARFEVGQATTTLIGHITTHMSRTAMDRFELMPLRSFAESLWEDLRQMAAEHLGGAPQQ